MGWLRDIRTRFSSRAALAPPQLLDEFGLVHAHANELLECLSVFDEEYGVKPGLLRPDDPIEFFTDEPRSTLVVVALGPGRLRGPLG